MSGPLAFFGLPADASARDVKRAYAQLLKQTRPDVDPSGFQVLHEAYQGALAWCSRRDALQASERDTAGIGTVHDQAEAALAVAESESVAASETPPSSRRLSLNGAPALGVADEPQPDSANEHAKRTPPRQPDPAIDAAGFAALVLAHALAGDAEQLAAWLQRQTALWSLTVKPQVGWLLVQRVFHERPQLTPAVFDVLAEFFQWRQLGSGIDPLALQQLRHALHVSWMLVRPDPYALGQHLRYHADHQITDRMAETARRQLTQRFSRWRALRAALRPQWPQRMRRVVHTLHAIPGRSPIPPLDEAQLRFWSEAGDTSRLSWNRVQVGASRCAVIALALILVLFAGLQGEQVATWGGRVARSLQYGLSVAVWPAAAWLFWILGTTFARWLTLPEHVPARWPWLRLGLVPLLLGLSLACLQWPATTAAASWLAAGAATLALLRLVFRFGWGQVPFWIWPMLWVGLRLAGVVHAQILWVLLGGATAWLVDCIRHWRALRGWMFPPR